MGRRNSPTAKKMYNPADIDATMREYVAIGQGVMDFKAITDPVKAIGFTGFLSLEQDGSKEDMKETCRRCVSMMKEYLA